MTQRRLPCPMGLALAASIATTGCGADTPAADPGWAASLAQLDPMFGGGTVYDAAWNDGQLIEHARYATRRELFRQQRTRFDAAAAARVTRLVPAGVATAATEFLATPAGRALARAEMFAATTEAWHLDDLPTRLGNQLADPEQVGATAATAIRRAHEQMAAGGSPSPIQLALMLAAKGVSPEQARSITTFLETDHGTAWQNARAVAWPEAIAGFRTAPTTTDSAWSGDPGSDLILPQDEGGK